MTLGNCARVAADISRHVDDYAPLIFYLAAMVVFHAIAHLRVTFPLWKLAWLLMMLMAASLAGARILFLLDGGNPSWWEVVRNALVIFGSLLMFVGGVVVWWVFRIGLEPEAPPRS